MMCGFLVEEQFIVDQRKLIIKERRMFNFKTVDGILKNFKKAVKDLEEVTDRETNNAAYWNNQSWQADENAKEASKEAARATKAANKIKEFIGE
jgi:tyrosyl-tRNA synthetase